MAKRLGEMICTFGWAVGGFLLWLAFHQDGASIPAAIAFGVAAVPAILGSMAYYVLSADH